MSNTSNAAAGGDSLITKPSSRLAAARRIWNERVQKGENPYICSSEGFYQHTGECANDSMQMVLCFCDHLKEVVQETLIKGDLSKAGEHTTYVAALQRRFVRHYLNEHERVVTGTTGKYRASGANALTAAIAAKYGPDQVSVCEYVEKKMWGMKNDEIQTWFGTLLTIFGLTATIMPAKYIDIYNKTLPLWNIVTENTVGFLFSAFKQDSSTDAHAMAYYKCGGVEYFYDDNYGPVPFAWSTFFDEIRKAIDEAETPIEIRIHHISMRFEVEVNAIESRIGAHPFYPVFEVCSPDKDMKKGVYYTLFPYGNELKTLTYESALKRYANDIKDKHYIWFDEHMNNAEHFGIFTVYGLMPLRYREKSTTYVEHRQNIIPISRTAVGRTGKRYNMYNPTMSSSNQSASLSNAAGVAVPPGILPDYESDDEDGNTPGHMNQEVHTKETNASESNLNSYKEDEGMSQGTQKRFKSQKGGRRLTRHKHHRAKRHTRHRHRSVHRKTKRVTRH